MRWQDCGRSSAIWRVHRCWFNRLCKRGWVVFGSNDDRIRFDVRAGCCHCSFMNSFCHHWRRFLALVSKVFPTHGVGLLFSLCVLRHWNVCNEFKSKETMHEWTIEFINSSFDWFECVVSIFIAFARGTSFLRFFSTEKSLKSEVTFTLLGLFWVGIYQFRTKKTLKRPPGNVSECRNFLIVLVPTVTKVPSEKTSKVILSRSLRFKSWVLVFWLRNLLG